VDVQATIVKDIENAEHIPGAIELHSNGAYYVCPCGCGQEGYLNFDTNSKPCWTWDGNKQAPTLHPSIHHQYALGDGTKKTHYHGWLKNGVWSEV